jgi:DNA-binding MarR family transcriptional regulator
VNRYDAATAAGAVNGECTLDETMRAVPGRLCGPPVDMPAMAAVSGIYRAAGAVRNYFERTVLQPHELTWTAWVVLWVVWIWGEIETRHVAAEAGISKGTLTGVAGTLERRGLITRRMHPGDARRVLLAMSGPGSELMGTLFPEFNRAERFVTSSLAEDEKLGLASSLRAIVRRLEGTVSEPSGRVPAPRPAERHRD